MGPQILDIAKNSACILGFLEELDKLYAEDIILFFESKTTAATGTSPKLLAIFTKDKACDIIFSTLSKKTKTIYLKNLAFHKYRHFF